MAKSTIYQLEVSGVKVPIRIYKEWRSSTRISIGRKSAILRIPRLMGAVLYNTQLTWAKKWLEKQFDKNPNLLARFQTRIYRDGEKISITNRDYKLSIEKSDRKTNSGKVTGDVLICKISDSLKADQEQDVIQKLIRRLIANDNLEQVTMRIRALNELHFQEQIRSVKLKYNTSNWGSCSNSGNVNISTRLLCAPLDVQNYVFIHELAHLKELNHSPRYWALVEQAMPEYKKHEEWLKTHGYTCEI